MVWGFVCKIILLVLPFLTRLLVNKVLGSDYLGLNSLMASVLMVLTVSELGISSAMVYHMYEPIANSEQGKINAILRLYRRAYRWIGGFILLAGLALSPSLTCFMSGCHPHTINLYVVYYIYLLNTVLSYFLFGYKQSLLTAYQREDIKSLAYLFTNILLQGAQILVLLNTRSYYLYVLCMPVCTLLYNLVIEYFARRLYPEAQCEGVLEATTIESIKKLVAGSFIQNVCMLTRNSLDSICISAFLGLSLTAIYNNYYVIFSSVTSLLCIIGASLAAGIGNHVVVKSVDENYEELQKLDFLYHALGGWCTACLLCLSQTFMRIWMGETMLLPLLSIINLCAYFYALKLGDIRSLYQSATGLWWKMRFRALAETLANLVLNIGLGYLYGINGIILATTISLVLCNYIWGCQILFRNYFGTEKLPAYFLSHLRYFVNMLVVCAATYQVTSRIAFANLWLTLIAQALVCLFLGGGLVLALSCTNSLFRPALALLKHKN